MDRDIQRPSEHVMNQPTEGLRANHHMYIPLLVPRSPLRSLAFPENPHHVGSTVLDESLLALAVGVRAVEASTTDAALLQ